MQELVQREQQSSESADDYIPHMRQLASRFQKPMKDRELVRIIKRGLKESLAKYINAMDHHRPRQSTVAFKSQRLDR